VVGKRAIDATPVKQAGALAGRAGTDQRLASFERPSSNTVGVVKEKGAHITQGTEDEAKLNVLVE